MPSNKDLIYLQFQSLLQFHNAAMHRKGNGSQCTVHCALHRFTMVGNAHFSAQLTSKSGGAVTQQNAHRFIFRSLEPILMSNTGKKSEKETLRKQHQCRRFRTDTGKLLQIQSLQATARMLVSTYSCVASNSHGVRVKNVHLSAVTKIGTEMCTKKCAHCKDLAFDFCCLPLSLAQT